MFTRLRRTLVALVFAWVAAVSVLAWLVFDGRRVALERGQRATAAFAAVVEQQTSRTFQAINLTLGAVTDARQLSPHREKNDPEFQDMMMRRLKDVPFVRAIFMIGKDGSILHDTEYPRTPAIALADRPYFRAYAQGAARAGTTWAPVLSRSGTGWFLPVTRPLGRSGSFEGVIVAAVQAEHFREQFHSIGLGEGYLIAVFHLDRSLVASYPARNEDVGMRFDQLPLFARYPKQARGSFWSTGNLVPGMRVVSYQTVHGAPLVVYVSRSKTAVLAEWRRTATGAVIAMLALTIFLGWFIARLVRESAWQQRERERRVQAEKLEALGQLTGGMAHDFANMLNIVALNVTLLRRRPDDPSVVERSLATLERAVRGGTQVVERLLSFARRRPLAITRVRLDTALEAASPLLAQAAGSRVKLILEPGAVLPEVLCDSGELDVALVNLVVNARDAMAGSGRITVRAFACDDESGAPKAFAGSPPPFVCLAVQDTGPGMTEEVRRRVLEPFFTTKGEAGTGLGLSQVYGFMQQLGGNMTIDSAPGRGAVIHLFFPVAPAPSGEAAAVSMEPGDGFAARHPGGCSLAARSNHDSTARAASERGPCAGRTT